MLVDGSKLSWSERMNILKGKIWDELADLQNEYDDPELEELFEEIRERIDLAFDMSR